MYANSSYYMPADSSFYKKRRYN